MLPLLRNVKASLVSREERLLFLPFPLPKGWFLGPATGWSLDIPGVLTTFAKSLLGPHASVNPRLGGRAATLDVQIQLIIF